MVKRVIKKIISVIVISSMLINSTFMYVEARDIKLLKVLLNDAIEDIEYMERESSYKEEHLSFLEKNETEETTVDNDIVGAKHREPEADYMDEPEDEVGLSTLFWTIFIRTYFYIEMVLNNLEIHVFFCY